MLSAVGLSVSVLLFLWKLFVTAWGADVGDTATSWVCVVGRFDCVSFPEVVPVFFARFEAVQV